MEEHGGVDIHTAGHGSLQARTGGYALRESTSHGETTLENAPVRRVALYCNHY